MFAKYVPMTRSACKTVIWKLTRSVCLTLNYQNERQHLSSNNIIR